MKRLFLIIAVASLIAPAFTQESQTTKELREAFLDGEYFLATEDYLDALPFYQQVYETDKDNPNLNYKIGLCYLNITGQKEKAIPYLEKAVTRTTPNYREGDFKESRAPEDAFFFLGIAYQIQNDFNMALRNLRNYMELLNPSDTMNVRFVEQQIRACMVAPRYINKPVYFDAISLGNEINTESDDFHAVVSGDGNSIVYITSLKFYDALFYSTKRNGQWTTPVNITPDIRSDGDHYPTGLSYDGTELLTKRTENFDSDIYESRLVDGKWIPAEKIRKGNINTKFWESHASYSQDGNTIYFTSSRTGGYGGLDIYKITRNPESGVWSEAVNLGPTINSLFNEETPFPCQHGKTLYFASQGHENMGGFDLFYASLQSDGTWDTPVNLGYPINSTDDDIFFIPQNTGVQGYLSMMDQETSAGQKDIYFLDIFSDRNPRPVEISGVVTMAGGPPAQPGPVRVTVEGPTTGFSEKLTAGQQGDYKTVSRDPGNYIITAEADGFIPAKQTVQLPSDYSVAEVTANIQLQPIPVAEPVVMRNVYFDHYSSVVKPQGNVSIMEVVTILNDHPSLKIEIAGYCDNTGAASFNKDFSLKRARAVAKILKQNGISANRYEIKGYGEDQFLAINQYPDGRDAPEGRKFNRRVEFHVLVSDEEHIITETVQVPENLKFKE